MQEYNNQIIKKFSQFIIDLREIQDLGFIENFMKSLLLSEDLIEKLVACIFELCVLNQNLSISFFGNNVLDNLYKLAS